MMFKMNLCFYSHNLQDIGGGNHQYFTLLAKKMMELGHLITMVSSGTKRDDLPSKVKFISLDSGNSRLGKYVIFPIKSLWFFLRHRNFDLIHAGASYSPFAYLTKLVSLITRIPIVYSIFADESLPHNISFDGLIFTSKRLKNKYSQGIYIPIFIDLSQFTTTSQYSFRKSYNFIVGTLGTPLPRRGHKFLVEAIPLVLQRYPNVHLVLAIALWPQIKRKQEKRGLEEIKGLIKRYNLENNVHIMGRVDTPKFFNSIDIFVYPLQTASGAADITPTILECLAAGCCLITTKVGAVNEIIKDRYNGILLNYQDRDNPQAYADKIIELIENRELYLTIKENAKNNLKQFDINNLVFKVLDYYRQIK